MGEITRDTIELYNERILNEMEKQNDLLKEIHKELKQLNSQKCIDCSVNIMGNSIKLRTLMFLNTLMLVALIAGIYGVDVSKLFMFLQ